MTTEEIAHWIVAGIFWAPALLALSTNVQRHFINYQYQKEGIQKRVSGVPFLFSIFFCIGLAASPLESNAFWILCLVFEIPALADLSFNQQNSIDDD